MSDGTLPAPTHIGRVTLAVADREAVRPFYTDVIGLEAVDESAAHLDLGVGDTTVLRLLERPGWAPRSDRAAGLFHVALRVPDRDALATAASRLVAGDHLTGASDHGVSEALYTRDPAGNGIEVYRDRPRDAWPRDGDGIDIYTEALDLEDLLEGTTEEGTLPTATDVGHVHLEVTDLDRAVGFYVDTLGFGLIDRHPAAAFVAAGGYHHHVGLNTWYRRSEPAEGLGAVTVEVVVPDRGGLEGAIDRLTTAGHAVDDDGAVATVSDPDGIEVSLRRA